MRAVPRRRDAERVRLDRVHVGVELVDQVVDLRIGDDVAHAVVAAVARREVEPRRDLVLVARDPHLDVVPDAPERVLLHVVALRRVRGQPEPLLAHHGRGELARHRSRGCADRLLLLRRQREHVFRLRIQLSDIGSEPAPSRSRGRRRSGRHERDRQQRRSPTSAHPSHGDLLTPSRCATGPRGRRSKRNPVCRENVCRAPVVGYACRSIKGRSGRRPPATAGRIEIVSPGSTSVSSEPRYRTSSSFT